MPLEGINSKRDTGKFLGKLCIRKKLCVINACGLSKIINLWNLFVFEKRELNLVNLNTSCVCGVGTYEIDPDEEKTSELILLRKGVRKKPAIILIDLSLNE